MSNILKVERDLKEEELKQNWQGTIGPMIEDSMFDPRANQNVNQNLIEESKVSQENDQVA